MLVTATYNVSKLYALLLAATLAYREHLLSVNFELVYGSPKEQLGDFYVTNGPMEVSYDQAELGCMKVRGKLLSVSADMNISGIFKELELQSTWTSLYKREDGKMFLDDSDFVPLSRTDFENIDSKKLDLGTFTDNHAIILRKSESCFEYVPVLKTTLHRAMCLVPIPFPRKRSTMSTLVAIKEKFLSQLHVVEKSMNSASQMVDSSMRILPEAPTSISTALTKTVNLEVEITEKINQLTIET